MDTQLQTMPKLKNALHGGWDRLKGGGIPFFPHHSRSFFEPTLTTPDPIDGHPTHLSTGGGFPPQNANTYVHLEVPTGMLVQPSSPPALAPQQPRSSFPPSAICVLFVRSSVRNLVSAHPPE